MEKTKHIMLFAGARAGKNASKMWGWITDCFIRLIALQMQKKLLSILHLIFGKCGLLDHLARWIFNSAESTHGNNKVISSESHFRHTLWSCEHLTRIPPPPPPPCFLPTSQDKVKTTPPCVRLIYCFSGRWTDLTPIGAFRRGGCINTA